MKKTSSLVSDRRGKAMMPGKMGRNLPMIAQQSPYASSPMGKALSSGYKKGGRVRGYAEAGEVDFDRDDNSEAQEVERKSFSSGVSGSKDYLKEAPARKAASKAAKAEPKEEPKKESKPVRASRNEPAEDSSDGEGVRKAAKIAGGVGLGAAAMAAIMSRGKSIPASIRALRNAPAYTEAKNISKMAPTASQKEGATRAVKGFDKKGPSNAEYERMINAGEFGYKKGGQVAKSKPTAYDRMQDSKMKKHENKPMGMAHKAVRKAKGGFAKRSFSRC